MRLKRRPDKKNYDQKQVQPRRGNKTFLLQPAHTAPPNAIRLKQLSSLRSVASLRFTFRRLISARKPQRRDERRDGKIPTFNTQIPKLEDQPFWSLRLGTSLELGTWNLELLIMFEVLALRSANGSA